MLKGSRWTAVAVSIAAVVLFLYPFLVYFGLKFLSVQSMGLIMAALACVRLIFVHRETFISAGILGSALLMIALNISAALSASSSFIKLQPVLLSVFLGGLFLASLFTRASFVQRIAELTGEKLPVKALAYTRMVTWVWIGFFACNGSIALYTVYFASEEWWLLYNGMISYAIMGFIFGCEYLVRQHFIARVEALT